MEFFHCAHNVGYVFNDVGGMHVIERTVLERVREIVQIADHIRATVGVAINSNRTRQLIDPAPDIEHFAHGTASISRYQNKPAKRTAAVFSPDGRPALIFYFNAPGAHFLARRKNA
jgi:hypothetical protein